MGFSLRCQSVVHTKLISSQGRVMVLYWDIFRLRVGHGVSTVQLRYDETNREIEAFSDSAFRLDAGGDCETGNNENPHFRTTGEDALIKVCPEFPFNRQRATFCNRMSVGDWRIEVPTSDIVH